MSEENVVYRVYHAKMGRKGVKQYLVADKPLCYGECRNIQPLLEWAYKNEAKTSVPFLIRREWDEHTKMGSSNLMERMHVDYGVVWMEEHKRKPSEVMFERFRTSVDEKGFKGYTGKLTPQGTVCDKR